MENSKQQSLLNLITSALSESDRIWKYRSDAFIIGYLEGALKNVKRELESNLEVEADQYRLQEAIDEHGIGAYEE